MSTVYEPRRYDFLWASEPAFPLLEGEPVLTSGQDDLTWFAQADAALEGRRSTRKFSRSPVAEATVQGAVSDVGGFAGSALPGTGPECFVVHQDSEPELLTQFQLLYVEAPVFVVLGFPLATYEGLTPMEYEGRLVRTGAYAHWIWMRLRQYGLECCPFGALMASDAWVRQATGVRQMFTLAVGYACDD
jgi:hypothetical protein